MVLLPVTVLGRTRKGYGYDGGKAGKGIRSRRLYACGNVLKAERIFFKKPLN
jgi:hypothetical protein